MKFVALRELKIRPSSVLDDLAKGDVIVTRNGKPAAALVFVDEDTIDEFIIAHHPTLLAEAEDSRDEFRKGGGIGHADMKALIEKGRGRSGRKAHRRG